MELPEGLTARAPSPDDAVAVYEVAKASEAAVDGHHDVSLEDIRADFRRPSFDFENDAVIVENGDGTAVGYADVGMNMGWVHVHPEHTGRGLGSSLLAWTERRASELGWPRIGQTISVKNSAAQALFEAHGYAPLWDSWLLYNPADAEVPEPRLPDGLAMRLLERPDDARAVYDVIDTAFSEWPNRERGESSFEDWRASYLDREDAEPDISWVVTDGDEIIGVSLNIHDESGDGWIEQLAVDNRYRGQGIGSALLRASFRRFRERGFPRAGLATDSRTGALDLYLHVGMQVTSTFRRWAKDL